MMMKLSKILSPSYLRPYMNSFKKNLFKKNYQFKPSFFIKRSLCIPSSSGSNLNLIDIFESGNISELEKYPPELVHSEINKFIEKDFGPDETYFKSIQKVLKELKRNSEIKEKEFKHWKDKFDESTGKFNYFDAEIAFNKMSETGLIHEPMIYNTMLAHHIRNDDIVKIGIMFTNMKEKKILNYETFMILTMYYCKKKNIAKAIDVYNDLLKVMNVEKDKIDTVEFKDTVFPYLSLIITSTNKFDRYNVAKTLLNDTGFHGTDPNQFIQFLENEALSLELEEIETFDDENTNK